MKNFLQSFSKKQLIIMSSVLGLIIVLLIVLVSVILINSDSDNNSSIISENSTNKLTDNTIISNNETTQDTSTASTDESSTSKDEESNASTTDSNTVKTPDGSSLDTNNQTSAESPTKLVTYTATLDHEYASVGATINAVVKGAPAGSTVSYEWKRGNTVISTASSYTPTAADSEKELTVSISCPGKATYTKTLYCSNLPVIYIDECGSITDEYTDATMSMQGNNKYNISNSTLYNGDVEIKLRGNSTKALDKKPYKLKLDSKADLFGFGESKHWVLLANRLDASSLRSLLAMNFSGDIGSSYYVQSDNVVLFINGKYQGIYQLCEHIRIGDNRIEIYDWENVAEDTAKNFAKATTSSDTQYKKVKNEVEDLLVENMSWITSDKFTYNSKNYKVSTYYGEALKSATGGVLLEMDFYTGNSASLLTDYQQPIYFNSPEFGATNSSLLSYTKKYLQAFEYAIHSPNHTLNTSSVYKFSSFNQKQWDNNFGHNVNTVAGSASDLSAHNGKTYFQLFDMNSLVTNYLTCELSVNWDSMKNSVFMYKDITGLMFMAPSWDFDWAFANNNMYAIDTATVPTGNTVYGSTDVAKQWHTTLEYFTREQGYQSVQWNRYLITDPYFLLQVYNKYKSTASSLINNMIKSGGTIEAQTTYLKDAAVKNDSLWSAPVNSNTMYNFTQSIAQLKGFITKRYQWLEAQFANFDTYVASLAKSDVTSGVYAPSTSIKATVSGTTCTAAITDSSIKYVEFVVNGISKGKVAVANNKAVMSNLSSTAGANNDIVEVIGLTSQTQYKYRTDKTNTLVANHCIY